MPLSFSGKIPVESSLSDLMLCQKDVLSLSCSGLIMCVMFLVF